MYVHVCVCVCVFVCLFLYLWRRLWRRKVATMSSLISPPPYFLRQVLLLKLELRNLTRETHDFSISSTQEWGQSSTVTGLVFAGHWWSGQRFPCFLRKYLPNEPSSHSHDYYYSSVDNSYCTFEPQKYTTEWSDFIYIYIYMFLAVLLRGLLGKVAPSLHLGPFGALQPLFWIQNLMLT